MGKGMEWVLWNTVLSSMTTTTTTTTTTLPNSNPLQQQLLLLLLPLQAPYLWVGGVLAWYIRYVPRLHPQFISISGIVMSEKALFIAWGIYILGYSGWKVIGNSSSSSSIGGGLVSAIVWQGGMGAALCLWYFQWNLLGTVLDLPSILVHPRVVPFWETIGSLVFFLDPPPPIHVPLLMTGGGAAARMGNVTHSSRARRTNNATIAANAAGIAPPIEQLPPPPSQDLLDQLTAMGFDEERARQALTLSHNNLERAADRLLMG